MYKTDPYYFNPSTRLAANSASLKRRSAPVGAQLNGNGSPITPTGRRKSRNVTPLSNVSPIQTLSKRDEPPSLVRRTTSCVCDFEKLAKQPHFDLHHVHYACTDPVLGAVVCQLAIEGKIARAHFFSAAGSMAFDGIDTSSKRPTARLPPFRNNPTYQALFLVALQYFARLPQPRIDRASSKAGETIDWTPDAIARLVGTMDIIKSGGITNALLEFLAPKNSKMVMLDVIIAEESPVLRLLPRATIIRDNDVEINKFPEPPNIENIEKRDNLIRETLTTERTYVARLQHLLQDYAFPLRAASRKQKGILGTYETNNLFPSTLDAIVLLNQDFLKLLESSTGDYDFALTMVNAFRDFRKVYARYLETSTDLDHFLRDAFKLPKFKEYADAVRTKANANISIRELIMEPISRIPKYSLLLTSILAVITPNNPAYPFFKEALVLVRRIGYMERDKREVSQETIIKLAALVSSWPSELVKSTTTVITVIDGTEAPLFAGQDGFPCSLVLFSDRVVVLKRSRGVRIEDVLQNSKKGELGYRGYIMLHSLDLIEGEDCLYLLLKEELTGVSSGRWVGKPYRKIALMSSDALKFTSEFQLAQSKLKISDSAQRSERHRDYLFRFNVYGPSEWSDEMKARKGNFRIWDRVDDGDTDVCNLILSENEEIGTWSCNVRKNNHMHLLCKDVSEAILRNTVLDYLEDQQESTWLDELGHSSEGLTHLFRGFAQNLIAPVPMAHSPMKSRPTSPSKIMSSFLGRKDRDSHPSPGSASPMARPSTGFSDRSFLGHTIITKRSSQLFSVGSEDRSFAGLDTFVEALLTIAHFPPAAFTAPNAAEAKQIITLNNTIAKDSKKGFAISGSAPKVAIHAFKNYCKATIPKRLSTGSVLSEAHCLSLRASVKNEPDARRTRVRAIIATMPQKNKEVLHVLLRCAAHVLESSEESSTVQCLLLFAEVMVPTLCVTAFISTLEVLLVEADTLFTIGSPPNHNSVASIASGMSLQQSKFGSVSSLSYSHYNTTTGSPSDPSRSPRKSSLSGTPDLVHGRSGADDAISMSRSSSSVTPSLHSDIDMRYKRPGESTKIELEEDNIFGLTTTQSHQSGKQDKSEHTQALPQAPQDDLASSTVKRRITSNHRMQPDVSQNQRDQSPVRSILPDPDAPYVQDDLALLSGVVAKFGASMNSFEDKMKTKPRRNITPSKIPIPSPRTGNSPVTTPTHSRDVSVSNPNILGVSRPGSSIPRIPSMLVGRRKSSGITRSFSNHSFTFDSELSANFDLAMKFSTSSEGNTTAPPPEEEMVPELADILTPVIESETSRVSSRQAIRREISSPDRLSSSMTVRRVSRQLEKTKIGPLEMPLPLLPADAVVDPKNSFPTQRSPRKDETKTTPGCNSACTERISLLELELKHYKDLYRQMMEEVDITLDAANEQIADLQDSLETGSIEAKALAMLELEKEKSRKLRLELGELRAQVHHG